MLPKIQQMDTTVNTDSLFMMRALELAQFAADDGEVPVGAVIVHDGEIVGEGYNSLYLVVILPRTLKLWPCARLVSA